MYRDKPMYDLAVAGGSVAGAVIAYLVARAGYSVAVFDPVQFPRRKPCGEGLSTLGRRVLESHGLWTEQLSRCSKPFYGYKIYPEDSGPFILGSETRHGSMQPQGFGVSRYLLDETLYRQAACCSTVCFRHEHLRSAAWSESSWSLRTADNEIRARHFAIAAGISGRSILSGHITRRESKRFGAAVWLRGVWRHTKDVVSITHRPEGCYLVTPVSADVVNVSALLFKGSGLTRKKILGEAFRVAELVGFQTESVVEQLGVASIDPSHSSFDDLPSVPAYLLGDTQERFDPIGGMGMTHALFCAELAADSIVQQLQGRFSVDEARSFYDQRLASRARILRFITHLSERLNVRRCPISLKMSRAVPWLALGTMSMCRTALSYPRESVSRLDQIKSKGLWGTSDCLQPLFSER